MIVPLNVHLYKHVHVGNVRSKPHMPIGPEFSLCRSSRTLACSHTTLWLQAQVCCFNAGNPHNPYMSGNPCMDLPTMEGRIAALASLAGPLLTVYPQSGHLSTIYRSGAGQGKSADQWPTSKPLNYVANHWLSGSCTCHQHTAATFQTEDKVSDVPGVGQFFWAEIYRKLTKLLHANWTSDCNPRARDR